jgi:hypothetical protein
VYQIGDDLLLRLTVGIEPKWIGLAQPLSLASGGCWIDGGIAVGIRISRTGGMQVGIAPQQLLLARAKRTGE